MTETELLDHLRGLIDDGRGTQSHYVEVYELPKNYDSSEQHPTDAGTLICDYTLPVHDDCLWEEGGEDISADWEELQSIELVWK